MNIRSPAAACRLHCWLTALFAAGIVAYAPQAWPQSDRVAPKAPVVEAELAEAVEEARGAKPHATPQELAEKAPALVVVSGTVPLLLSSPSVPTGASLVLTSDRLHRAGDSAADVLRSVAGVQVSRQGSKAEPATASLRGADAKQTPVYLAGVRLNDDVNGSADLSTIPLWMMQRAEVFRGNSPAASEQLGLGGAIFFEPRRPSETRLGMQAHIGSFGERGASIGAEVGNGKAAALISLRATEARNDYSFINDHGLRFSDAETNERRENADYHDVDGWAIGSLDVAGTRLGSVVHILDREQGTTGIATTPARHARTRHRRLLAATSASMTCATSWSCSINAQTSLLVGQETVTDPRHELRTVRSRWQHSRALRHTHRVTVALELSPLLTISPYLNASEDRLDLHSLDDAPRDASRASIRTGLEAAYEATPTVDVHAMLATDCLITAANYRDTGKLQRLRQSHCRTSPDARLGSVWRVSEHWSVLGNISHSTRPPTLGELYGVSASLHGEPDLLDERGYSIDVGVRRRTSAGAVEMAGDAFVFRRWTTNLVRYRQTSLHAFSPYNVGDAQVTGAEVSLGTRILREFEIFQSLTLLDPRETTEDRVANSTRNDLLPLMSRFVTHHSLSWSRAFRDVGVEDVGASLRYFYRSNRFADPAGLVVLPEQHAIDAAARIRLVEPDIELGLAFNNLSDERQIDMLGQPLPGRSYHASLQAWW